MKQSQPFPGISPPPTRSNAAEAKEEIFTQDASPPQTPAAIEVQVLRSSTTLSIVQCRALENMMIGQSMSEAARGAGVARATLYRWINEDADFRAAYNAWQRDTIAATRASVLALTEPAIRAVAMALEKGNSTAALTVLKSLGLLTPPTPGPTNADEVRHEQKIAQSKRETDLLMANLEAGLRP